MDRRRFTLDAAVLGGGLVLWPAVSLSQGLASISDADAGRGLKAALETGAVAAVSNLGAPDGFLGNPKVHIPLPGYLNDAAKFLKAIGRRKDVEELEIAINRAAEAAMPLARDQLVNAVKNIGVRDAKRILLGGDNSVTQFFAEKTREAMAGRFLPVVQKATAKVGLAARYDKVAGKAAGMGLVKKEDATIDHYVTRKALDGLYYMIGEEERRIRRDPLGSGSALLGKVFGALR